MLKHEIKDRFGELKFTAEIECAEDSSHPIKTGLAAMWALENGVNLQGADLRGVNLQEVHGINDFLKCIHVDRYPITYTADIMQIGCERHTIDDWREFNDARILEMDGKDALKFWRKCKELIFQTIELCPAKPTNTEDNE